MAESELPPHRQAGKTGFAVDSAELEKRLGYHRATPETLELHRKIRAAAIAFGEVIKEAVPEGREKSLAFTALQEAGMYANAGIACNLAPLTLDQ